MKFTVILPVYYLEKASNLKKSIQSLFVQTLLPDEIIIVVDGPVGSDLQGVLDEANNNDIVTLLQLSKNYGVGVARRKAIEIAKYNIIALMDSDDMSCDNRFEKQIAIFESHNVDVVGGWVEEFKVHPGDLLKIRKVPASHLDIFKFGKWRMPVNNVTLMFKRESYERVGGYSVQKKSEDWNLIVKLIANGYVFFNIPEVLVNVKVGNLIQRRRGHEQILTQLKIFTLMYKLNYIGVFHLVSNITIRVILRLLPTGITSQLYRFFLRNDRT